MYALYNAFLAVSSVLTAPWWLWKLATSKKHRAGIRERLGKVPGHLASGDNKPAIWVHAVSVGEVLAISRLISELRRDYPQKRIVISATTATGQKLARERFGQGNVFYFPLDFAFAIRPYLKKLRPELVILAETEFWPNFIRMAKAQGARIAVVNARISDRSLPGYRRWRRWMLRVLNKIDLFLAQTEEDARRLVDIGAHRERVHVSGNLKFDLKPPECTAVCDELREIIANSAAFPVLVCGSTMQGEELALLGCFQKLLRDYPDALMILAPRHPERFEQVAELASCYGTNESKPNYRLLGVYWQWLSLYGKDPSAPPITFWRRSHLSSQMALRGGVMLLDSIGELAAIYSLATVAFVGGSLVPQGGHNILEPAYFGIPILIGPYTENFRQMVEIFERAGALRIACGFSGREENIDLCRVLGQLVEDTAGRREMGERAAQVVRSQAGATERTLTALRPLIATKRQPTPELAHAERLP